MPLFQLHILYLILRDGISIEIIIAKINTADAT